MISLDTPTLPEKFLSALKTLNGLFVTSDIRYQVTGGLAAWVYGSYRSLYDIDVEVEAKDILELQKIFRSFLSKDLYHLHDQHFDLFMMTLDINGVPVDISQSAPIILCDAHGVWQRFDANVQTAQSMDVGGMTVPIVARDELLRYKTIIGRSTDFEDIQKIEASFQGLSH